MISRLLPWIQVESRILAIASGGGVAYASLVGTVGSTQMVNASPGVGFYCSLALDQNNYPYISYQDNSDQTAYPKLGYSYWNGTGWSSQIVSSGAVGFYTSIALDKSGHPHISHMNGKTGGLLYAELS